MKEIQNFNFEYEQKKCSDVYEVLSHIAIFKPLISCVFPEYDEKFWIKHGKVENRKIFLETKENLKTILKYFKDTKNLEKFSNSIEEFYLNHKEALDRVGINNSHKNTYSLALTTIIKFNKNEEYESITDTKKVMSNTSIKTSNFIFKFKNTFDEILITQKEFDKKSNKYEGYTREVIGDIYGNLANEIGEGLITNFNGKQVTQIKKKYIDVETRKPIIIKTDIEDIKGELINFGEKNKLSNGDIVTLLTINIKKSTDDTSIPYGNYSFYVKGDMNSNNPMENLIVLKDSLGRIINSPHDIEIRSGQKYIEKNISLGNGNNESEILNKNHEESTTVSKFIIDKFKKIINLITK